MLYNGVVTYHNYICAYTHFVRNKHKCHKAYNREGQKSVLYAVLLRGNVGENRGEKVQKYGISVISRKVPESEKTVLSART